MLVCSSMITVYSRPNCHLCERAVAALVEMRVHFSEVDISKDPFLEKEFGIFVPVIQRDGKTIFEAGMDPRELPTLIGAEGR